MQGFGHVDLRRAQRRRPGRGQGDENGHEGAGVVEEEGRMQTHRRAVGADSNRRRQQRPQPLVISNALCLRPKKKVR